MLEDWLFPFPAQFLIPLFFPRKASAYSVGVDFAEALFLPYNGSPLSSSSGISHYELLSHVCTFTESKFTSHAKAQTLHGTSLLLDLLPQERKQSH